MSIKRLITLLLTTTLTGCVPSCEKKSDSFEAHLEKAQELSEKARMGRFLKNMTDVEYEKTFSEALKEHAAALSMNTTSAEAYYQLGRTYFARGLQGDPMKPIDKTFAEKAEKEFDRAIEFDSKHTLAWDYRCLVKLGLENYDGAIADAEQVAKLDPSRTYRLADAYCLRGQVHHKAGKTDLAIADYERSVAASKDRDGCTCDPFGALKALKK